VTLLTLQHECEVNDNNRVFWGHVKWNLASFRKLFDMFIADITRRGNPENRGESGEFRQVTNYVACIATKNQKGSMQLLRWKPGKKCPIARILFHASSKMRSLEIVGSFW